MAGLSEAAAEEAGRQCKLDLVSQMVGEFPELQGVMGGYYARRAGTRWGVELAVSDELLIWRPLGEVLGPSGDGFDSMGARSPDAVSGDDRIELIYSGQDGVSFQLGYAERPAPSGSAPSVF